MTKKDRLDQWFRYSEDVIYIVIGILLILTAFLNIYTTVAEIFHDLKAGDDVKTVLHVIDRMLLTIMLVEILYTVRVSLKSHVLCAEPFLIVGLIAAVRRILVISVESAYMAEKFKNHMIEIGILGVLIFIFVGSIILLKKQNDGKGD